ncbi:MAG: AMP-binding protein [Clostridiales bacterium]|nr:AMP-binding protein [Clostridiales bacterium]
MHVSSLQEYILDCCEKHSSLVCCKEIRQNKQYTHTYTELLHVIKLIGSHLASQNKTQHHAALLGHTSFEWIASYLGALCYGIIVIPLNANAPQHDILEQFVFADADILIYDATEEPIALLITQTTGCHLVCLNGSSDHAITLPALQTEERILPILPASTSRVAEILFTSGTTGKEKAVMLTDKNILCSVLFGIESFHISKSSVVVSVLPNHHAYELAVGILIPLYFGVTIATMDRVSQFLRNLAIFRPEVILAVPALMEMLRKEILQKHIDKKEDALQFLGGKMKTIICGGAFLREDLAAFFRTRGIAVLQGYGLTECGPIVSCDSDHRQNKLGKVSPYCQVLCIDGEILIQGENVMAGYYKDPAETACVIRNGWFHTGDLGSIDKDGYLSLFGRLKNLIILENGENVSPERIENLLSQNEIIKECLVFGENNLIAAEIFPDAEYIKQHRINDPESAIWAAVSQANRYMPKYMQIERVYLRHEPFQTTSSKKIVRSHPEKGKSNE